MNLLEKRLKTLKRGEYQDSLEKIDIAEKAKERENAMEKGKKMENIMEAKVENTTEVREAKVTTLNLLRLKTPSANPSLGLHSP